MDDPTGRLALPHALMRSHEHVASLLKKAIEQLKRSERYSDKQKVCHAIERFVHELWQEPAWREELEQRANLVAKRCAPGSPHDKAKSKALKSYRGRPRRLSGLQLAIDSLRGPARNPTELLSVVAERKHLERILSERGLGLSDVARDAFNQWLSECRRIQREAARLEVDGCRFLYHIYAATLPDPPDGAASDRSIFERIDMGDPWLKPMLNAADSLVAWVRETLASGHERPKIPSPRRLRRKEFGPIADTIEAEAVIEVKRWAELGIGIDEDGSYLAVTPCPGFREVFPKKKAVRLHLPGKQWERLLDLLAQSEEGNTASKKDVMVRFGHVKAGDLPTESVEELVHDHAKMRILTPARKRLTGAIADLARNLREQVRVKSPEGPALSVKEPKVVRAGFVARHLIRDRDGKLRFGGDV